MKIFYTQKAAKQLRDLPRLIQKRIVLKMCFYAKQENPLKFAKRLTDYREGEFRFRIGIYRLIFDVKRGAIYILKIDKRDSIYNWDSVGSYLTPSELTYYTKLKIVELV